MAVAVRPNGLHHAVSLGTIGVSSNDQNGSHLERNYDSEDENMSRRRLRHTSSTELYSRTSVYSKGDIREQYCLTDRQLNSIERPRRADRLFGCLSRRSAPQSFLGVCVGRRIPSDDNLTAYAPFNNPHRYSNQHGYDNKADVDTESSYFRRQPASILSTSKMTDASLVSETSGHLTGSWIGGGTHNLIDASTGATQSSYHCPHLQLKTPSESFGGTVPSRTKHVSFARSHTLTSFDDVKFSLRSSGCMKTARSQERLIGGKKPMADYDAPANIPHIHHGFTPAAAPKLLVHRHADAQYPHAEHMHATYPHAHGHAHLHGHLPFHQYIATPVELAQVHTKQPLAGAMLEEDMNIGMFVCPSAVYQPLAPPSPEVVVVEKKFRSAMKTQATQTDVRKIGTATHILALSPRTVHNVKVVSQGAQTNGGAQNVKKLAKSLSEMPKEKLNISKLPIFGELSCEHELLHRTQSEEPPRSPLEALQMYYKPPPPLVNIADDYHHPGSVQLRRSSSSMHRDEPPRSYDEGQDIMLAPPFDYVSNSLPRRACTYHRIENEYTYNSLPRSAEGAAASSQHDICKHITECTELLGNATPPLDFNRSLLLPPPQQYRHHMDVEAYNNNSYILDDDTIDRDEPDADTEETTSIKDCQTRDCVNRRMSMVAPAMQHHEPAEHAFRRGDMRRQSMPLYVKTEKLIDGYAPRSSFRSAVKPKLGALSSALDEKEIFIDFKPHLSPQISPHLRPVETRRNKLLHFTDGASMRKDAERESTSMEQEDEDEDADFSESVSGSDCAGDEEREIGIDDEEEEMHERCFNNMHEINSETDEVIADGHFGIDDADATYDVEAEDPLYENVIPCCPRPVPSAATKTLRNVEGGNTGGFWERSVSLDETGGAIEQRKSEISAPPSPCREELLMNDSTYPSSDSLTNDITRDHSDGIWNESQVTVLTAVDPKDVSEGSLSSNLLTPSSKRKNFILQHQQRSSIDTDAIELEEHLGEVSPTYSNIGKLRYKPAPPRATVKQPKEYTNRLVTPSIAVTPSVSSPRHYEPVSISPKKSPNGSRRSSKNYILPLVETAAKIEPNKNYEALSNYGKLTNTDVSECSTTNTDEYATCTDTSKKTPGTKTTQTATSSSSTTHVPVSTQSSQMDKTQDGSSFESASSLYSTRGDLLGEELSQHTSTSLQKDLKASPQKNVADVTKKSPSNSISSTSSGSYNVARISHISVPLNQQHHMKDASTSAMVTFSSTDPSQPLLIAEDKLKEKFKPQSVSDDERSEKRYSSSGYYESPREEDHVTKMRRHSHHHHRLDEERKKRKTFMKLDIEKENMRALTSPIKRLSIGTAIATVISPAEERSLDQQVTVEKQCIEVPPSYNKIKRFRPKIRRQLRRSSRDGLNTQQRQQKQLVCTEKLIDRGIATASKSDVKEEEQLAHSKANIMQPIPPPQQQDHHDHQLKSKIVDLPIIAPGVSKSVPDICGLKAKSVESLRSVSPGSDSVFYSEADGNDPDQQNHCLHCGNDVENEAHSRTTAMILGGDSVESLPCAENEIEQDIVKPPSDFADSPVTTKTTQRLYKKMDKRFRSEDRYHGGERGRLYKSRQENLRAKSEERGRDVVSRSSPWTLRPAGSSPCVLPDTSPDQNHILYRGHYDPARYTRLTDTDVWKQLSHQNFDRRERDRDRSPSTASEHNFRSKYQVILHRLVQRRCTLEMYHRQNNNTFELISSNSAPDTLRRKLQDVVKLMLLVWAREGYVLSAITCGQHGRVQRASPRFIHTPGCVDKTIVVKSDSGEFGFRIHGSKPVVVAAIEPETPAESSGLEVGDIIISVNGVQVLDKHHTEVVKIAHDGCEKLELQVARTIGVLMNEDREPKSQPIYCGFLWRQSGQARGTPNTKNWVRRWFSLRPDNCLYYYKTEDDSQPVGAMIMVKHTIEHCSAEIGKPHAFKVDSGEGIPLYVAADSEELKLRWINLLQQSATQGNTWLDKCSHNLYQQPSSIVKPDCFGYLLKLGSRWCGWSKRYCVLKDACLYFYQDANSKCAFGMTCLHGYKVASMSASTAGKKNSFEIIPAEPKLRHYYFSTESEMDKKRWISALEYSIDRWIKSG